MSDFYTGNQKRNAIRTEFVNLAAGEDGVVSWDLCGMYKKTHRIHLIK